ncbi:MAG: tetratricopeptide repeat protein, partial [Planctomycetota bacterium]
IGTLESYNTVYHPTKNLLFGARRQGSRNYEKSDVVVVYDEETLAKITEIEIGDEICGLAVAGDTLVVAGPTNVYPVALKGLVPDEALGKAKIRWVEVDFTKPPSKADIAKAEKLVSEGQKAYDRKKSDLARKKFEEALGLDPRCPAKAGLGMVLLQEDKFDEAIDLLKNLRAYPFRDLHSILLVYERLGIAQAKSGMEDVAILTFRQGLSIKNDDAMLLKNLAVAYANTGKPEQAYIYACKAQRADKKTPGIKKLIDGIMKNLIEKTKATCPTCRGKGKHEYVVEEEDGSRTKVMRDCKTCDRAGKVWKRPCVDCTGSGKKSYYDPCETCWGSGWDYVPLKKGKY